MQAYGNLLTPYEETFYKISHHKTFQPKKYGCLVSLIPSAVLHKHPDYGTPKKPKTIQNIFKNFTL